MSNVIKDLGIQENGRRYFKVKCADCDEILTVRADRDLENCRCKVCQAARKTKIAKAKADAISKLTDTKVCTKCKLKKHIYDFDKKASSLSGHRSVCKACRYFTEREKKFSLQQNRKW